MAVDYKDIIMDAVRLVADEPRDVRLRAYAEAIAAVGMVAAAHPEPPGLLEAEFCHALSAIESSMSVMGKNETTIVDCLLRANAIFSFAASHCATHIANRLDDD